MDFDMRVLVVAGPLSRPCDVHEVGRASRRPALRFSRVAADPEGAEAVLEGELKLKEKIITDFCDKLTINFLDFNGTSHAIHAQVDSFLLIRKLIDYLDVAGVLEKERELQA